MPDPTRDYAYASVRVSDPGHGDPICLDPGLGWYSLPAQDWQSGSASFNASGRRYLQADKTVGLICRAFLVPQNTRSSQFNFSGGLWEERQVSTGRNVYRLNQLDTANTVTSWAATSTWLRPKNAPVAVSLILPDTPADWDWDTYPPFIRIEISAEWGVEFTKEGTFLMRRVAGNWVAVHDLPSPPRSAGWADDQETWMYVRVERGQLGVSFDFGRSYEWYAPANETVTLAAGKLTVRGRGGAVTFGIHQLRFYAGSFDSYRKELERPRLAWSASFAKSIYDAPLGTGGGVAFTDLGNPVARQAQWRVTLTPGSTAGLPFTWYFSPAVYGVHYRVPPEVQVTGTDSTTPWDDTLSAVKITKPARLDGSTAEITFTASVFDVLSLVALRWRRCEVELGYVLSDDTTEPFTCFVGYVEEVEASWGEDLSEIEVTVHLANASAIFRRDPWTPFTCLLLSGQTPNDAGDEILASRGRGTSYRSWHAAGASGLIALGNPDEPNELTRTGELPWETLSRIFQERSLELGVADDGVLYTAPQDYVAPTVSWEYRAAPEEGETDPPEVRQEFRRIRYRIDFKESATAALVYGTGPDGQLVFRYAYDPEAETNVASERFSPFRETRLKELPGSPDAGLVTGHCQALAGDAFLLKREIDLTVPLDVVRSRRERVAVYDCAGLGIPDGTECVLLTLSHSWRAGDGWTRMDTTAGLRRLDT
jgi:hypothetical protein